MKNNKFLIVAFLFLATGSFAQNTDIYRFHEGKSTRWASFENPNAEKGKAELSGKVQKATLTMLFSPANRLLFSILKGQALSTESG